MLYDIQQKFQKKAYEYSKHAVDQMIHRNIRVREIEEAIFRHAEVVEKYPEDKYGPSCLILGFTSSGRPLHILCSYPSRPLLKIITTYEPDPDCWVEHKIRKPNG